MPSNFKIHEATFESVLDLHIHIRISRSLIPFLPSIHLTCPILMQFNSVFHKPFPIAKETSVAYCNFSNTTECKIYYFLKLKNKATQIAQAVTITESWKVLWLLRRHPKVSEKTDAFTVSLFHSEYEDTWLLQNFSTYVPDYSVPHPRRQRSYYSPHEHARVHIFVSCFPSSQLSTQYPVLFLSRLHFFSQEMVFYKFREN